jgi:transcriptional antiterminator RfaH
MSEGESSAGLLWYCVKTAPKREHMAAARLRELPEVEVLCPRLRYRKATRRGKVWWQEALFPGYLLARFDLGHLERAVTFCQNVRGLVRFGGQVPPVPESFVHELRTELARQACEEAEILTVVPTVEPGQEVEIAHGPLQGFRGPVLEVLPAADRVRVLLEFLGQPQAVNVDLFSILLPGRPLPKPPDGK